MLLQFTLLFIFTFINLDRQNMSKGHYLVRQIMQTFQKQNNLNTQQQSEGGSTTKISLTSPIHSEENIGKCILLRKKQKNFSNRMLKLYPSVQAPSIYNLFGFMGINQKSLDDSTFEESFFYTYFQGRVVKKVEFYAHALVIELAAPMIPDNQLPVQYFIEKYKSKGDTAFFEMGSLIQEVYEMVKSMPKPKIEEKTESIKGCLDLLGDKMFVCTLGLNKVAISNSLLTYLEYDLEEFAIEAIKHKTIFYEFFSSISYKLGVLQLLKNFKYTALFNQNKISLYEFNRLTTWLFTDFIYSKTNIKSYCDMSFSMINPTFFCHKIDFVYYSTKEPGIGDKGKKERHFGLMIEGEKERVRQLQYHVLKKVKNISSRLIQDNQRLIAGYKENDSRKQIKQTVLHND